MRHEAKSTVVVEKKTGILCELFTCTCGATMTAGEMVNVNAHAAFGGRAPCPGIRALWEQDVDKVVVEE